MCKLLMVALAFAMIVGCSGESKENNADTENGTSKKPPLASRLNSMDAAEQRDDSENDQQQRPRESQIPADQSGITESDVRGDAGGMVSQPTGEMNNGLFPPMSSAGAAGFGGALFPDFKPSNSSEDMSATGANVAASSSEDDPFDLDENDKSDSETIPESAGDMTETESATEITLLPAARRLFEEHAESEAINSLYGHHLVSDDSRSKYELNWYPGLKEPRLFFRWGVGIIYSEPRDYSGRHPVIGDPGEENESSDGNPDNSGGRGRGGLGIGSTGSGGSTDSTGARTFKDVDTTRPDGYLLYYTGDFGVKLISQLEKRLIDDEPFYGAVLKDVVEIELPEDKEDVVDSAVSEDNNDPAGSARGDIGLISESGGPPGQSDETRGEENSSPSDDPKLATVIDRAMGSSTAEKPADDFTGSILPGVMLLGVGSKADLVERARKADVDSLIVFSVNVAKSRRSSRTGSGPSQSSTTSMKIIDLNNEGNKNLFSSKGLKDVDVAEMIESGKDPVDQEVERAFREIADSEFRAIELPAGLNLENVKNRIGRLLNEKPDNPLPTAVEIVSFYESDLLTDELAITAMKSLFGSDNAEVLVKGTASQRLEFLKAWLPASLDK